MITTILLTAVSVTTATVSSTIAKHFTKKILDKFVRNVDLLISEGTVLNRNNRKNMTEYF